MQEKYQKKYEEILAKINSNSYNIKKKDYQLFRERTKKNTIYSFYYFSKTLFDDKVEVGIVKDLFIANRATNKISYKRFKQLRLNNFYCDLFLALNSFCSYFMSYQAEEALQVAYHTKGSYEEKAKAAFEYLKKERNYQ